MSSRKGSRRRFITRGQSYDDQEGNKIAGDDKMFEQQQQLTWQDQQMLQQPANLEVKQNLVHTDANGSGGNVSQQTLPVPQQQTMQQIPQQQSPQLSIQRQHLQQPHLQRNVVRSPSLNSPRTNRHQFDKYQNVMNLHAASYQHQQPMHHQPLEQARRISLNDNNQLFENNVSKSPRVIKRTLTTPGTTSHTTDASNSPSTQRKINLLQQSNRPQSRVSTSSRASVESEPSAIFQQQIISSPRLSRIQKFSTNTTDDSLLQNNSTHHKETYSHPTPNPNENKHISEKFDKTSDAQKLIQNNIAFVPQQPQMNYLGSQQSPRYTQFLPQNKTEHFIEQLDKEQNKTEHFIEQLDKEQSTSSHIQQVPYQTSYQQELFRHSFDQFQQQQHQQQHQQQPFYEQHQQNLQQQHRQHQQDLSNTIDLLKPRSTSLCDSNNFSASTPNTQNENQNDLQYSQRNDKNERFENYDRVFKSNENANNYLEGSKDESTQNNFRNISEDINEELRYNQQILSFANNKKAEKDLFNNVDDDVNTYFNILNNNNNNSNKVKLRSKEGNKHFSDESSNRSSFYDNFPYQHQLRSQENNFVENKNNISNIHVFKRPNFGVISQVVPSHMVGVYDPSKYLSLAQSMASTIPTTAATNIDQNYQNFLEPNTQNQEPQKQLDNSQTINLQKHSSNSPVSKMFFPVASSQQNQQTTDDRQLNQLLSLTSEGPWTKEKSLFARSLAAVESKRKELSWGKYESYQKPVNNSGEPSQIMLNQQAISNTSRNVKESRDSTSDNYVSASDISHINQAGTLGFKESFRDENELNFHTKNNSSLSRSYDSINKNNLAKNKNFKHIKRNDNKFQSHVEVVDDAITAYTFYNNSTYQQQQQHDVPQTCVSMKQLHLQNASPQPNYNVGAAEYSGNYKPSTSDSTTHTTKLVFKSSSILSPQPMRRAPVSSDTAAQLQHQQQTSLPFPTTTSIPLSSGEAKRKFITSMTIPENEIFLSQQVGTAAKTYNNSNRRRNHKNNLETKFSSGSLSSSSLSSSSQNKPLISETFDLKGTRANENSSEHVQKCMQHVQRSNKQHELMDEQAPKEQKPQETFIREEETTTLFTIPQLDDLTSVNNQLSIVQINNFASSQPLISPTSPQPSMFPPPTTTPQPTQQTINSISQTFHRDEEESSLDSSSSVDDSCSLDDLITAPPPEQQPTNASHQATSFLPQKQSQPVKQQTPVPLSKLKITSPEQSCNLNRDPQVTITTAKRPPPLVKQDSFNSPDSPPFHQPLPLPTDSVILHHRRHNLMQCSSFQSTSTSSGEASDQEQIMSIAVAERNRKCSRKNKTRTLV
ncbi:hypothetical protein HELRODRAFT_188321 [Helobdella robusta]|uniref:Uncharacterized protein n=1 Tax=Helobdella robusta TaxID=6412 RepID=T1FPV5_HELRO|nr:hypothetical protein HELRODRAFT_188321 [Helobdella robusta]ESO06301.1 hypothetical protein HELRODRAFT_188321 [Helobdella robusta]